VLKNFKADESLTLEGLAEDYGMKENIARFLELLHKAVGKENFSDMEKIDARRRKRSKEDNAVISRDVQAKVEEITTKIVDMKEETTMKERTVEIIKEEIVNIDSIITLTVSQRDTLTALIEDFTSEVKKQEKVIEKLKKEFEAAQNKYEEIKNELTNNVNESEACEKELSALYIKKASLEEELKAKEIVYLFAPGKGGLISKNKHYVSTYERQGVILERIPSQDWAFNWSMDQFQEKAIKYGYTDFNKLIQDVEFAQLVIYYKLNNKPFELIADHNPNVLAIINDEWERREA
jgi:protein-tyrosine-phosphatase